MANYNELKSRNYADDVDIRLKRQKYYHRVEYYDGVRIDPNTLPKGKYMYQTRHSDTDMSRPVTIVPRGTFCLIR